MSIPPSSFTRALGIAEVTQVHVPLIPMECGFTKWAVWPAYLGAKAETAVANAYNGRVAPHYPCSLYPTAFKN